MINYKKLIQSSDSRSRFLELLSFVPDNAMVAFQYFLKLGRWPNFRNPKRFSEKLILYKLFYRNELMPFCADKITARKYVAEKGFSERLVPLIATYDSPDCIDFSDLDEECFLKCSSGSHGNVHYVPGLTNRKESIAQLQKSFDTNFYALGREWAYKQCKNRIIAEKALKPDIYGNIDDYKFFCFNGVVALVYVCSDRDENGNGKISLYDGDFNKLPVRRKGIPETAYREKPLYFEQMIRMAESLSAPFPHVRVDLYNIDGSIYFGEMTFYTASGYLEFDPDSFDYELGASFSLDWLKYE